MFYRIISAWLLATLALPAHAQSVYQLMYVHEGTIETMRNVPLQEGKYYAEDAEVRLKAKKAIFYDTTLHELATVIHQDTKGMLLRKLALPIKVEGFKCCVTGFTSFIAHHLKPYPVLYPDMVLELSEADEMKFRPHTLAYKFWDTTEKTFKTRTAVISQKEDGKKVVELHKIIHFIQTINKKDIIEPFFFYKYNKDAEPDKKATLIKERALQIINTEELKNQIRLLVKILKARFPAPQKPEKEYILSLLSDFVYELCGYPDEIYFKKWLKEHFKLDLAW